MVHRRDDGDELLLLLGLDGSDEGEQLGLFFLETAYFAFEILEARLLLVVLLDGPQVDGPEGVELILEQLDSSLELLDALGFLLGFELGNLRQRRLELGQTSVGGREPDFGVVMESRLA